MAGCDWEHNGEWVREGSPEAYTQSAQQSAEMAAASARDAAKSAEDTSATLAQANQDMADALASVGPIVQQEVINNRDLLIQLTNEARDQAVTDIQSAGQNNVSSINAAGSTQVQSIGTAADDAKADLLDYKGQLADDLAPLVSAAEACRDAACACSVNAAASEGNAGRSATAAETSAANANASAQAAQASEAAAAASQTAAARDAQSIASSAAQIEANRRAVAACLPLAGGTMNGDIINAYIRRLDDTGRTVIAGGTGGDAASLHGACLFLSGSEDTASWITPGCFILYAMDKAGHGWKTLVGKPDGTLTWNGKNVLTTTNGLPLSGGTMTGDILYNDSSDNTKLTIAITDNGGRFKAGLRSYSNTGAYLDVDTNGHFGLCANDGTQSSNLNGYAGGVLSWCGKTIETVDSSGTGWIRYTSGLQLCWGRVNLNSTISSTNKKVTFQKAFNATPSVLSCNNANVGANNTVVVGWETSTSFNIGTPANITSTGVANWIAIGTWK